MNQLNPVVYQALQNYQESYEFYRSKQRGPQILRLKVVQNLWNSDEENENQAA